MHLHTVTGAAGTFTLGAGVPATAARLRWLAILRGGFELDVPAGRVRGAGGAATAPHPARVHTGGSLTSMEHQGSHHVLKVQQL